MDDVLNNERWQLYLRRLALVAHNAFMADEWTEVPERAAKGAAWMQVAVAVVQEMQTIMDERAISMARVDSDPVT